MNKISEIKQDSNSYLSFRIGDEFYAAHVGHVNNIVEVPEITSIPNSPDYIKGILNLRHMVLPVIDTRVKLNMEPTEYTSLTCILVLEINHNNKIIPVGAMVDAVQEVLEIRSEQIAEPPQLNGLQDASDVITGVVNMNDHFIFILSIDNLFDMEYISGVDKQIQKYKSVNV